MIYILNLPNNHILKVSHQGELYIPSITYPNGEIAQIEYVEILKNIPTLTKQDARFFKNR